MSRRREPVHCIVPNHILVALAGHKDRQVRDAAFRSLVESGQMRGRREVLGQTPSAVPAGTKRRTIYDAQNGTNLPGVLVRGEGDPATADDAVNEAHDGLGATYDLYSEIFQRNSIDDRGLRLDATVHFDQGYDNAFFDGRQMVFGDGDGVVFVGFTKAIDVIGHELTHGVTQFTANLVYRNQPGALNESMSDVFGSLVKQYALGQTADEADWLIGAGILAPGVNGAALRSMKAPGTAYNDPVLGGKDPQPATMSGYIQTSSDNGGVHLNSGIPNHAFFLAASQLGGYAWEEAGLIWYETLKRLWPTAQFQDCANLSALVAGDHFGVGGTQQQAVLSAWSKVGVPVTTRRPRRPRPRRASPAGAPNGGGNGSGSGGGGGGGNGNGPIKSQLTRLSEELLRTIEVL